MPIPRGRLGDDLLGQYVERLPGDRQAIELAPAHAVEKRGAFDEFVARQREEPPLWGACDGMARPADALEEGRDGPRRPELANEIDIADVDA